MSGTASNPHPQPHVATEINSRADEILANSNDGSLAIGARRATLALSPISTILFRCSKDADMTGPRPGDRIRLLAMPDDPAPISPGTTGTVRSVNRHGTGPNAWLQVDVDWDNGRSLMISIPPDEYEVISDDRDS
jgi:hypothetical protein